MTAVVPRADVYVAVQPVAGLGHFANLRLEMLRNIRGKWAQDQLCTDAIRVIYSYAGIAKDQFIVRPLGPSVDVRVDVCSRADFDREGLIGLVEIPVPGLGCVVDFVHGVGRPTYSLLQDDQAGLLLTDGPWGRGLLLSKRTGPGGIRDSDTREIVPVGPCADDALVGLTKQDPEARFALRLDFQVGIPTIEAGSARACLAQTVSAERVVSFEDSRGRRSDWVKCPHTAVTAPFRGFQPISDVSRLIAEELSQPQAETKGPAAKRPRRV